MSNDTRSNRYSLKIIDSDGIESVIKINCNGKVLEKMPLSKIDQMTTCYKDKDELMQTLLDLGYPNGYIFIEYIIKGKRKILDIIYNDMSEIAKECNFRETEIAKGKKEPKISENTVLLNYRLIDIERNNKKLWSYLQKKNYMWTNLTMAVATYNYLIDINAHKEDLINQQAIILKIIGDYRKYRDIYFGIYEFYKKINKGYKQEDIIDLNINNKVLSKKR